LAQQVQLDLMEAQAQLVLMDQQVPLALMVLLVQPV
jgi:hypothetical protein